MDDNTYDQQPDIRMPRSLAGIPTGGYKLYSALLTQAGSAAPTANILQNTIGEIVWTRTGAGVYYGTLTNAFPADKTQIYCGNTIGGESEYAGRIGVAPNIIVVNSWVWNGAAWAQADDQLSETPVEIRVYDSSSTFQFTPQPPQGTKIYTAWLTQSGTNAPTTEVLQNTIGAIVWTRRSAGIYDATLTGAFPENKTTAPPFAVKNGGVELVGLFSSVPFDYSYTMQRGTDDLITLHCFDNTGSDAELSTAIGSSNILITINVYP